MSKSPKRKRHRVRRSRTPKRLPKGAYLRPGVLRYKPTTYQPYQWLQALNLFRYLNFTPLWLIDCGPGLGQEARRFKEQWPRIDIVGLEASPRMYETIKGDYPGILMNAAVWDSDGSALLYSPESVMGSSLVLNTPTGKGGPIEVPTVTIDTLDARYGFSDAVLWADVESAEPQVLRGAAKVIERRGIRLLNLEVHSGDNEREVDRLCREMGFIKVGWYNNQRTHHDNVYKRVGK